MKRDDVRAPIKRLNMSTPRERLDLLPELLENLTAVGVGRLPPGYLTEAPDAAPLALQNPLL
jgi:hypothetical protein